MTLPLPLPPSNPLLPTPPAFLWTARPRQLFVGAPKTPRPRFAFRRPAAAVGVEAAADLRLPNRAALLRALTVARQHAERNELALVVVDIDDFAAMNLTFGATYGHLVLRKFAAKLRRVLPAEIFIARVGHNLFGVLGAQHVIAAEPLRAALGRIEPTEKELGSLSLALATVPLGQAPVDAAEILDAALITLRHAKAGGCGRHAYYDPQYQRDFADRYRRFLRLRNAVEESRVEIELQPQIELATGKVVAVEALARLRGDDGRSIAPGEFVPLAESTGLILPLGRRVVELACEAAASLREAGHDLRMAINLSALQFAHTGYFEWILNALRDAGSLAERFEIEITESLAVQSFETVRAQLLRFRELGVSVALDDFGTGFSSLSYLLRLPIDRLKIDRTFIEQVTSHQGVLAEMVLQLGRQLTLPVVAEGVETPEQVAWLRQRGCDRVQGFLYARPMPVETLKRWLHERCA